MKMRKWYVVLIALAVIAIAWGIGARIFIAQKSVGPVSPLASVSLAYYTNAKGQSWAIQTGDYSFNTASAEQYPKFVLGNINPVKVSIGDTQTMQIMVRDNVPLTKVWAEVENDKSTDSIPLTLGASSTVSYNTIQNQKYLVGNDGKLVINDGQNKTGAIAELIQSLVQKAQAEQAVDYSYSGSWVVHDTRTITYHTTFYAMDAQGRTAQLVLAWSDPCGVTAGTQYSLSGACGLTNTWGVDSAVLNMNGQTVTLSGSGNLVYNNGQSITGLSATAKIVIGSGTQISKNNLYFTDADGDGWTPSTTMNTTGGVRVASVSKSANDSSDPQVPAASSLDCDDVATTGVNVHPGQTAYYSSPIAADGSSVAGTFRYACGSSPTINPAQVSDSAACTSGQDPKQYYTGSFKKSSGACLTNFTIDWCNLTTAVTTSNCGQSVASYGTMYVSTCSGSTYGPYVAFNSAETLQCH